ncbi:hypothetical protein BKA70DRAFT_1230987 [Coprinopsis sp. MPI-PUGE-AT-0042]|nr:hypothetical protein BKA70DRAFT_1230987 [Coprinopsis sp. MPI-PUGE-AT-0042]
MTLTIPRKPKEYNLMEHLRSAEIDSGWRPCKESFDEEVQNPSMLEQAYPKQTYLAACGDPRYAPLEPLAMGGLRVQNCIPGWSGQNESRMVDREKSAEVAPLCQGGVIMEIGECCCIEFKPRAEWQLLGSQPWSHCQLLLHDIRLRSQYCTLDIVPPILLRQNALLISFQPNLSSCPKAAVKVVTTQGERSFINLESLGKTKQSVHNRTAPESWKKSFAPEVYHSMVCLAELLKTDEGDTFEIVSDRSLKASSVSKVDGSVERTAEKALFEPGTKAKPSDPISTPERFRAKELIKWYARESGGRNVKKYTDKYLMALSAYSIYRKVALKSVNDLGAEKFPEPQEVKETDADVALSESNSTNTSTSSSLIHARVAPESLREYASPATYQKGRMLGGTIKTDGSKAKNALVVCVGLFEND